MCQPLVARTAALRRERLPARPAGDVAAGRDPAPHPGHRVGARERPRARERGHADEFDLTSTTVAFLSFSTSGGAGVASASLADGTPLGVVRARGNRWRVLIPGIMAHHLGDRFDVVVTTSGGTTARASVAAVSFVREIYNSVKYRDDEDGQRMAASLWRYWEAADAYMREHS